MGKGVQRERALPVTSSSGSVRISMGTGARIEPASATSIRDTLQTHIRAAARALQGARPPSDEAVHAARKHIKRARALLRLLREAAGSEAYRREKLALRDAARQLSRVRDATVMLQSLQIVRKRAPTQLALDDIDRALRRERLATRREILAAGKRARLVRVLAGSEARVGSWRLAPDASLLLDAMRRLYRAGRRALRRARSQPSEATLHQARKQVKYLELVLEPFQPARSSRRLSRAIKATEAIEEDLGRSHDLAVLRARIVAMNGKARKEGKALLLRIDARRNELDDRALQAGRRFYARRPKDFARKLRSALAT
jgi:CHAD domain-containing protein